MAHRFGAFLVLTSLALGRVAAAESALICSAGARDGAECSVAADCPGGSCVKVQGACDGGANDGLYCDCAGGLCVPEPMCSTDPSAGTCNAGVFATSCCDVTFTCEEDAPCRPTQKLCTDGENKGFGCLSDEQCPDGGCRSTGRVCVGGRFSGYSCVDGDDCSDGVCEGPVNQAPCTGDCNGNREVTVDELLLMVNGALGNASVSACVAGDANGDGNVTVNEIVTAVNAALNGCPTSLVRRR